MIDVWLEQEVERYEACLIRSLGERPSDAALQHASLKTAAYHARKGNYHSARSIVAQVRERFENQYAPEIFVALNLVDGIGDYFEIGPTAAIGRLTRALAISNSTRVSGEVKDLTCGWLATCYRQMGKWTDMRSMLRSVLIPDRSLSHDAACRASIVIIDALQDVGEYDKAQVWSEYCRRHAGSISDDTVFAALLYNRAAIRLFNVRLTPEVDRLSRFSAYRVDLEAECALNYTKYVDDHSISWVFDILRGQFELLDRRYQDAVVTLGRFEASRDSLIGWPSVDALRAADLLLARSASGSLSKPEIDVEIRKLVTALSVGKDLSNGDLVLCLDSIIGAAKLAEVEEIAELVSMRDSYNTARLKDLDHERHEILSLLGEVSEDFVLR